MAIAYKNGGSGSSGIRTKKITAAEYENLSDNDRNNPYVIWLIVDRNASDSNGLITDKAITKICTWDVYKNLPDYEKYDEKTIWIISDKSESDIASLGFTVSDKNRARLYDYAADIDAGSMLATINMLVNKANEHSEMLSPVSEKFGNENLVELLNQMIDRINAHTEALNKFIQIFS